MSPRLALERVRTRRAHAFRVERDACTRDASLKNPQEAVTSLHSYAGDARMGYELTIPLKGATLEIEFDSMKDFEKRMDAIDLNRIQSTVGGAMGRRSARGGRSTSGSTRNASTSRAGTSRKKTTKAKSARGTSSRSGPKSAKGGARKTGAKMTRGKSTKGRGKATRARRKART